jgi:hypothetical protein
MVATEFWTQVGESIDKLTEAQKAIASTARKSYEAAVWADTKRRETENSVDIARLAGIYGTAISTLSTLVGGTHATCMERVDARTPFEPTWMTRGF